MSYKTEFTAAKLAHSVIENGMTGPTELEGGVSTNAVVAEIGRETREVFAAVYHGTPMAWPYHTKQLVPGAAVFTYERESPEDGSLTLGPWRPISVQVFGRIAKNDGTPGQASAEHTFYFDGLRTKSDVAPEWLVADANRLAPAFAVSV